ncbi:hypothetical protein D0Y65_008868 [Glycine soja]|uniref:DUF7880 domain-containing protein n=1 Tax=Glycine soja TaxID=3848 RepID=A0A445KW35_GLYSO|nr:hypothetical protein D0Y65_008868 [Glycine soja]
MASLITPAHVSNKKPLHLSSWKAKRVRCAVSPPTWREGLRTVSLSLVISHLLLIPNRDAAQANPFDKYVKSLLTKAFLSTTSEKTLEGEEPQFTLCRSPSRSGPAASLRVNIRASLLESLYVILQVPRLRDTPSWAFLVVQYAFDSGNGKTAFNDVDECLRSLEELDSLLLHASRNDPEASVKSMKTKINSALGALDSLLQTVPSDVLSKGEVIADSYREPEDEETGSLDPDLKQLESIL